MSKLGFTVHTISTYIYICKYVCIYMNIKIYNQSMQKDAKDALDNILFGCLQGNGPNQGPGEYPSQVSGAAVALRSFGEFVLLVGLINSSR